ncbi:MAG: hypothetical protein M0R06_06275, partial [Sphaerochaeta sp.]|nr:hypothetical protein [Sphaerochaeta sp.]
FAASRIANEAAAIRLRADTADMFYKKAEKQGIDLSDPVEVATINQLVNSMTGRGKIKGMGERESKTLNELFFSPKFVKSTLDTFLQPFTLNTKFGRTEALYNLVSLAGTSAFVIFVKSLFGGKEETDPTSSDFGQIRDGNTRIDTTGGAKGPLTLLARLYSVMMKKPIKSAMTGISKVPEGFGAAEPLDLVVDYAENKVAPLMGLLLDMSVGKTFEGKPLTLTEGIKSLFLPIIVDTGYSATEADGIATGIAATVADFFGASASTYQYSDNWNQKTSKEMVAFKKRVGQKRFDEANAEYEKLVHKTLNSTAYEKANNDDKKKMLDKAKDSAKKKVMFEARINQ